MIDTTFICKGVLIGFSIAAPVGPVGILCIRRSVTYGKSIGFVSGLGAACADSCYGLIAGVSVGTLATFADQHRTILALIGGLMLSVAGFYTMTSIPLLRSPTPVKANYGKAFFSTFLITLTNPMTVATFIAVFAGLGVASEITSFNKVAEIVFGILIGSTLWWLLLSTVAASFGVRLGLRGLLWINRVSGFLIGCFGLYALSYVLW